MGELKQWILVDNTYAQVDFKAKKIEADLRVPCCGREQTQYASLVAYLKGKLAALEWGYERAHLA